MALGNQPSARSLEERPETILMINQSHLLPMLRRH